MYASTRLVQHCCLPSIRAEILKKRGTVLAPACSSVDQQPTLTKANAAEAEILGQFWQARGVFDGAQQAQLINCVDTSAPPVEHAPLGTSPLPGVGAAARLSDAAGLAEVQYVSQRLLQMYRLLGERNDLDVVSMITREPRLLDVGSEQLLGRLIQMKIAAGEEDVDVAAVAAAQPALLLADLPPNLSFTQQGDRMQAWRHGVPSDSDAAFQARHRQLLAYVAHHGDAHVGFRSSDDPGLARWCAAQRAGHAEGTLATHRITALEDAGFMFDSAEAEWARWYNQLAAFQRVEGHCSVSPLASGDAFLLINWCSVQRIANRAHVLSEDKRQQLDLIGFDWTGADALS
mmetsp:Transcript_4258/g.12283  ORF Transcript_4258/g.12283 Transcript_4258/m.12283 type:complete len:346 (+) Transcript_4258:201-1238(+)|eukprot:CAMPEP_0206138172 /NCGR_PEP_ID=MMETSP1473-20131121/3135_1 /ASSEMBLY_ACC=CAM_ASM_001109 /TAXON_ID=1461547 /ORGANISM="Stichococcus sp, Strain RCC1054" /LENGTH=345 /DNA_ID=CAMNT_0053531529 /DNA_START=124 /DNA_END=1161 /DNA_ORIENTATION=+